MKRADLNLNAIRRAIAALPSSFSTFDLVEHSEMTRSNERFGAERNYRAEVGKTLKEFRSEFRIREIEAGTSRGSLWEKLPPKD